MKEWCTSLCRCSWFAGFFRVLFCLFVCMSVCVWERERKIRSSKIYNYWIFFKEFMLNSMFTAKSTHKNKWNTHTNILLTISVLRKIWGFIASLSQYVMTQHFCCWTRLICCAKLIILIILPELFSYVSAHCNWWWCVGRVPRLRCLKCLQ